MATIINASINLSKIDKTKMIQGKDGALYYNIEIYINDEKDKFENDVSVAERQTKEQREAKEKKNYLGNGRVVWTSESKKQEEKKQEPTQTETEKNYGLPF